MPLHSMEKFIQLKEEIVQEIRHCCEKFRFEYGVAIN
ncbi:hypothetical protein Psal073_02090 [Piscirickettsia salmonis]|nr:hypothetical protein Psal073_02090 [Piscirickettsia salmonis]